MVDNKDLTKYQSQGLRTKYLKSKRLATQKQNFDNENPKPNLAKLKDSQADDFSTFNLNETRKLNNDLGDSKLSSSTINKMNINTSLTGFVDTNEIQNSEKLTFELSDDEIDVFSEMSHDHEQKTDSKSNVNKTEFIASSKEDLIKNDISSQKAINPIKNSSNPTDKNLVLSIKPHEISVEHKNEKKRKFKYKVISYWIIGAIAWIIIILLLLLLMYTKK